MQEERKKITENQKLSIEQAANIIAEMKKEKPSLEGFQPSQATREDRNKYLLYCISQCKDAKSRIILTLRAYYSYSYGAIARFLQKNGFGTTTEESVKSAEKEAINRVREAIAHTRATKVPIIGGT